MMSSKYRNNEKASLGKICLKNEAPVYKNDMEQCHKILKNNVAIGKKLWFMRQIPSFEEQWRYFLKQNSWKRKVKFYYRLLLI